MAKDSLLQKSWNNLDKKKYFALGIFLLLFLPFLQGFTYLVKIPILSDIYFILQDLKLVGSNSYTMQIVMLSLVLGILAASWDILSGFTGQFSFGHALFLGFSAYLGYLFSTASSTLANLEFRDEKLFVGTDFLLRNVIVYMQTDPFSALFYGAIGSLILAVFIGLITLRLKGSYFALVTLITPLVFSEGVKQSGLFPGKEGGIPNVPRILPANSVQKLDFFYLLYFLIIFVIVVGFFLLLAYSGGSDYVKKEINKRFKTNENLSNFLAIFIFSFLAFIVLFIIVELVFILDIFNVFKFSITEGNYTEVDLFNNYVFILIMFFVTVGIMAFIAFSRLGDIFLSIREDEEAAESLGINVTKYKILAFSISAFFAGIAGGLYTQLLNVIGPSYFDSTISFKIVIMVIIGGIGTIYGGVLGSFIINFLSFLFLDTVFKKISGMEIFVLGALLIFVLLYLKSGIVRAKKDEKKAIVIGILLAISWTILANIDIFSIPDIVLQFALFVLGILTLPAIPIFIIGEEIGLFVFNNIMSLNLSPGEQLIKGKFLIYIVCGIPYALYLPKIFKKARIKFWGIWPSIGIYEPEN